ncbi:GNAT family N-acetyltransferase [Candidatus Dependentiae bacterium]|nr:GNAT family N-acetyltransferase [Candidatus Dependentiae bacterium]
MSLGKKFIIFICFVLVGGAFLYFYRYHSQESIRDMSFQSDFKAIDALFHKGDNWYWLICNANQNCYSVDFLLRYKTSSQYEKRFDLIAKVIELEGKIAGFTAYYPKSKYTWQFLFLLVDQDFRRQGIAKKLLTYAVKDMLSRGAIKIDLVTRVENVKAQSLYKNFGFKVVDSTEEHVYMTWHSCWQK